MAEVLNDQQINEQLTNLPGWTKDGRKITKLYEFGSFREAMSFMVRIAFEAEQLNHHPELHNVYNRVRVLLSTHDAGDRVTDADVKLARAIEDVAWV